jgi:hypothetical protein
MEGHPMLMDQHNSYFEIGYTTGNNLYVQCSIYHNSNDILICGLKVNPEVHMKAQKSSNSQSNPEQKQLC